MSRWALRAGLAGVLGIVLVLALGAMLLPVRSPVVPSVAPSGPRVSAGSPLPSSSSPRSTPVAVPSRPLAGVTLALDPGHQLGNFAHPAQINRLVPAGGFRKACNTTGTATTDGVPEATVVWRIVRLARVRLERLGADVRLTRRSNSARRWGPCVDVRGRFGGRVGARLEVSVHADGAPAGDHGFHVIAPERRAARSPRTARSSLRLAKALRAALDARGIARSDYIGDGTALSIRSDLATLNLSTVPVAMVEIGNMANPADAHRMTSRSGRRRYAAAVVAGIRRFLGR